MRASAARRGATGGGASAGTFSVDGSTLSYDADNDNVDQISGFDTGTSYRFTRFGGLSSSS